MNEKLVRVKEYIKEQFDEALGYCNDNGWIEGWICGYTDPDHHEDGDENNHKGDELKEELLDYLQELRKGNS
jgi:hypothetical protein